MELFMLDDKNDHIAGFFGCEPIIDENLGNSRTVQAFVFGKIGVIDNDIFCLIKVDN